jgi:hypothetical protein
LAIHRGQFTENFPEQQFLVVILERKINKFSGTNKTDLLAGFSGVVEIQPESCFNWSDPEKTGKP